ncbi:protein DMR6-LIKE OXYGENASE 1-like isoform X2 [Momordica charantia]|uniref:Protein DMR6-LIKE OXYGENASE 1-like isoform X2 n=1 Tax=Momordica charantia TaxID=3673 RepID=A0A6J1E3G6_MOMCH|nr:protein DMR6-LIKE OXYGENASE 1-like isoform X2 [Momordica charantia]XP_022159286.1 protein DMR6-LIKE OXYGENASE 1-like isoform X2 [Momordica charantia]
MAPPAVASVKTIAETPNLASIPSSYIFSANDGAAKAAPRGVEDSIPTIDFSLLTMGTPDQRAKVVDELGKACQDWGFFVVMNHGVEERVMREMIDICREFFDLTEEEKTEYKTEHVLDPIRYGTSFNPQKEKVLFWRDYLKIFVHPKFHSPTKPPRFREILEEYCKRSIEMARELVRGISESLGLETCHLERAVDFESCSTLFAANFYPPYPQPELARGLPSHSDQCLLTLLLQNQISGLQILHQGNWVDVNPIPNSFLVNVADQLEILSNGKYKSVLHRAMVNNKATRLSIAVAVGSSPETVIICKWCRAAISKIPAWIEFVYFESRSLLPTQ